ncbi:uncharacterized protein LOC106754176 isoform X4 [Vigna radiata var. radiata]|uniref:Uncharacterized protein LOC106754176 isoform X4 n=1 Tax=Vigna radiata var. radiata TaxID=3916 RepID=A0A3Q0ETS0_VIGRR|nr:uncharacterized protein LOC106754176 isoform X4 [Vigna radiata var. radiata]
MATVPSLCTVFPILTPILSKPHFVPLSSRTPKRSRIISCVAEDREIVPVSEDRGARFHEVEGIQPSESITEAEVDPRLTSNSTVNAFIVLGFGTFAVTKLLTIDHDYWHALFPFQEWWVVPAKVAFDQTVWSAVWNSIYFVVLGLLRFESLTNIYGELKSTFFPLLTAGWKLWPFAHLITYGLIPVEQRLLWVDCVELVWVTILSTYSNEKSETRISESASEATSSTSNQNSKVSRPCSSTGQFEGFRVRLVVTLPLGHIFTCL